MALFERLRQGAYPRDVVKQIEQIEEGDYIYLVSTLMNRSDLANFMQSRKVICLAEEELRGPARRITNALKSVHGAGFLHNDIQPCNIYLHEHKNTSTYSVKLSGFSKCQPINKTQIDCMNASYELED